VLVARGEHVVEHRALVVVEHLRAPLVAVEAARELDHVVGAARLGRVLGELAGHAAGVVPHLRLARPADRVDVGPHDDVPEVARYVEVAPLAGVLEEAQRADHLGDVLVGVDVLQGVHALLHGHEELVFVEHARGVEELAPAGALVEPGQGVVHAAELAGDVDAPHGGELLVREAREPRVRPGAHALRDLEREGVAEGVVAVEEAREDLVEGVVGRPDLRVAHVALEPVELLLREAHEVALVDAGDAREGALARGERGHEVGGLLADARVARGAVAAGERGEVVAGRVAPEQAPGRVPAHHLRGAERVQPRGRAEVVEHLVVVDRKEEGEAALLLVEGLGARVEAGGAGREGLDRAPGGRKLGLQAGQHLDRGLGRVGRARHVPGDAPLPQLAEGLLEPAVPLDGVGDAAPVGGVDDHVGRQPAGPADLGARVRLVDALDHYVVLGLQHGDLVGPAHRALRAGERGGEAHVARTHAVPGLGDRAVRAHEALVVRGPGDARPVGAPRREVEVELHGVEVRDVELLGVELSGACHVRSLRSGRPPRPRGTCRNSFVRNFFHVDEFYTRDEAVCETCHARPPAGRMGPRAAPAPEGCRAGPCPSGRSGRPPPGETSFSGGYLPMKSQSNLVSRS
jgi:hypothetical protein